MSGEVNCGYWNGDLFFFSYRMPGIQVAYTWRWVFCEKAGPKAKEKPALACFTAGWDSRWCEREDGDETVLDILSPHYLALSVNYYPPSIVESPFTCSRCTSPAKPTSLADYVFDSSDIPCADTPRAAKEREEKK